MQLPFAPRISARLQALLPGFPTHNPSVQKIPSRPRGIAIPANKFQSTTAIKF